MDDRLLLFWGKTAKDDSDRYHPLLFHMLDVANVALRLWDECLPPAVRMRLAVALGLDEVSARATAILLAGLHDIGKASPPFQAKDDRGKRRLSEFNWPVVPGTDLHGKLSTTEVRLLLSNGTLAHYGISDALTLAAIVGGHHGIFPNGLSSGDVNLGDALWAAARADLARHLCSTLRLEFPDAVGTFTDPALVPLLAGFISVADWLGSWEAYFPPAMGTSLAAYTVASRENAAAALARAGWHVVPSPTAGRSFRDLFSFDPNEMQSSTVAIADEATGPYLLIVEEAMGGGKTEAALFAADRVRARTDAGFYVAMPTQATSNAMHQRIETDYLDDARALLVHGNALLHYQPAPEAGALDVDGVTAGAWFTARKRPLLAPFGVGTIDQSLLAVLQTKHWFVRLFGLAGKTVIFDEVHAYDVYMTDLLKRLLRWLSVLDCTVVILSATLPAEKRRALLEAYGGRSVVLPETRYPRLSSVTREGEDAVSLPLVSRHAVALHRHPAAPDGLADLVAINLPCGGCGAIVCNTVARAQEVFNVLKSHLPAEWDVLLFHARMPANLRRSMEDKVLGKFGRKGKRPSRAILVATQVVEQSLDLDFDWMASDFSPVDLLLQRSGRVWRHMDLRPAKDRPAKAPVLTLLCDGTDEDPRFGDSAYVYDGYALLRSWLALQGVRKIAIPAGIEFFVERAYGPETVIPATIQDRVAEARAASEKKRTDDEQAAKGVLINEPCRPDSLLRRFNADLDDSDDPNTHETVRAATRLGRPSLTVVCLEERDGRYYPFGCAIAVDLIAEPDHATTLALLDAALTISHPAIYHALKDATPENRPAAWRRNAHLRHARFLTFSDGRTCVAGRTLHLTKILGLEIPTGPKGETE